jgi:hypothetical protein
MEQENSTLTRRDFGKWTALGVAAALSPLPLPAQDRKKARTIGIQIGAVSFTDEGVDKVLDFLQEHGAINTIFLTAFTYGRGLAGRQIPGQPFPDHGPQESDGKFFHGGNYARPHPEFYARTVLKNTRAPDLGDVDILELVLPAAKKRALNVICSCEDVWRRSVPNIEPTFEIDLKGRQAGTQCLLNPDVRNFWTALVTDYCKSYPIDGILFFNERNGPLLNALGASHAQRIASGHVTCFCPLHQEAARQHGINFQRVREGYEKLDAFVQSSLVGHRPTDGYFVEFWRLLVNYPEIIAWDRLFDEGKHQVLAEIYSTVKAINQDLQVGFHIEHVNSFNPIFRATRSYADLAQKSDFLKVVVYNNCGGERYRHFIDNIGSTVFRDVPKDELLQFNNHLLNYTSEKPLDKLPQAGLSPDYVFRETKRGLEGAQGRCRIYPGIDIGIPTGRNSRKASPQDTYQATSAALKAGADGLIFSRKYSEMRLDNISAAGRAVHDFRV